MSHQVLSLKYRPQNFDELVGQEHVGRILRNALTSERVGHAYLLVGPRGVGKTTTARIFAKALNCAGREEPGGEVPASIDPCGKCASCRDITAGSDLDVVEMDAASNNHVDDVRRLREQVGYATVRSRYRIWIVDEVHMLSLPAFNAFLKTLEEPPEGVKFVFCTTEEHKLPETFRSRCQRIEFRPIDAAVIATRLRELAAAEGAETEDGLCEEIAGAAGGGLRDAESLLEQLIAACPEGRIRREDLDGLAGRAPRAMLARLTEAVDAGDAGAALRAVDDVLAGGCKPGILVEQWMETLRVALVAAATEGKAFARTARSLDLLLQKRMHLRSGADGVLICQVAAVELARLPDARDLDALIDAIRQSGPSSGGPPDSSEPTVGGPGRGGDRPRSPAPREEGDGGASAPGVAGSVGPGPAGTGPVGTGPAGTGPAASGPPTGERMAEARMAEEWGALVDRIERDDGRLAEALRRGRPGPVRDGYADVELPAGDRLARSTIDRREAVLAFRRATRQILGVALAPRTVPIGEAAAPAPPPSRPADHPSVRRVTDATGGQLLNVERANPGDREGE